MKRFLIVIFIATWCCQLTLQAVDIERVAFKQTNGIEVSDERLLAYIQQRPGEKYDAKMVNEDIKRIFNSGDFSDVTVNAQYLPNGKVELIFNLEYQSRIKSIQLKNNAKYKDKDLRKEIILVPDTPLNNSKLQKSLNNLREFYRSKGYNDATVGFKIEKTDNPSEVDVIFFIEENLRLKVNNVTFEGNKEFSNLRLKYTINNRYSPFSWLLEVGLLNREELELDKIRLKEKYWTLGYLDFEVKDTVITVNPDDPEFVDIHFVVEEGDKYTVGDVKIEGNTVYETADLRNFVVLNPGEIFNFDKEITSIRNIASLYDELGYNDIQCEAQRFSDFENKLVNLNFVIKEGNKYNVRDIIISGNTITKDKVMRRELAIQPGDPVDRNRVEASKARLMGMGYFKSVETEIMNADALDEKDIGITVEEKDMFNFSFGAGFSDVNSLMGMVELSNNNFDILDPLNWFSGGGQRLRLQGIYGIKRSGFNLDFSEPWLFDIPLRFDVNGYLNQSIFSNWSEERIGVRTALTKKVFDDFTTISAAYKFESVRVYDMTRWASVDLRNQKGTQLVSQFSTMIDRDTRDSLMMPTSGYNVNLMGAISPKILGSTEDFYRMEAKGSAYYSIFNKAITFMGGAKIGTIGTFGSTKEAPLFERYFMGGGDSLRGFDFRTVSPLDANGVASGGQTMLLLTGEMSHPIWDFIRGAAFVDVGNVWRNAWEMGTVNMGMGYGLRIIVPYLNAPVKIDLAYPIINNQPGVSSKLRFHFNMGFTF